MHAESGGVDEKFTNLMAFFSWINSQLNLLAFREVSRNEMFADYDDAWEPRLMLNGPSESTLTSQRRYMD